MRSRLSTANLSMQKRFQDAESSMCKQAKLAGTYLTKQNQLVGTNQFSVANVWSVLGLGHPFVLAMAAREPPETGSSCPSRSEPVAVAPRILELHRETVAGRAGVPSMMGAASTVMSGATLRANARTRPKRAPEHLQSATEDCKFLWPCYDDGTALSLESKLGIWLEENASSLEKSDVRGRLAKHCKAWLEVCSDAEILSAITKGYLPPFWTSCRQATPPTIQML